MKAQKRNVISVFTVFFLAAVMFAAMMRAPAYVYADDGAPVIARLTTLRDGANTDSAGTVWYGGRAWVVIGYDGTGNREAAANGVITLISKGIDTNTAFNYNNESENANAYSGSALEDAIFANIADKFSDTEKKACFPRYLTGGGENNDFRKMKGRDIPTAMLWPLSAVEAVYLPDSILTVSDGSGGVRKWWLRTPGMRDGAGTGISDSGTHFDADVSRSDIGVRPAFDLDPLYVCFLSAARGGKDSGDPGGDALLPVGANANNEWKVTLMDDSHSSFGAAASSPARSGGTVEISYHDAVTGSNEYISAMIADADGNYKYYGKLAQASETEGTVTVDLAGKFGEGDTLYVFNEQCNKDNETDYASPLSAIALDTEIARVELTVTPPACGTAVRTPEMPTATGVGNDWDWSGQTNRPQAALSSDEYAFSERVDSCVWISIDPFDGSRAGLNGTMTAGQSYLADIYLDAASGHYFGTDTAVTVSGADVITNDLADSGHIRISVTPAHDPEEVPAVPATCDSAGNKLYYVCAGCGKYFADSGAVTEITNHADVILPAEPHEWGEWKVTKAPTETGKGLETRTCRNDPSHTETREIPAKGKAAKSPKTGDGSPSVPWALMAAAAAAALAVFASKRKTNA